MQVTRRQLFRTSAATLFAAGAWPTRVSAAGEAFRFVVVNDLHSLDAKCEPWLAKAAAAIQAAKPEFVLVVGDLAEDGTAAQLGRAADAMKTVGVPYHVVPGNHDYRGPTDRGGYDAAFPGKLNYRFNHGGWQFVGIDSTDGTKYDRVAAGKDARTWLDAEAPKLEKVPTVLFTHFPLGAGVKMRLTNADAVLDRFKGVPLVAAFNGHYHAFTEKTAGATAVTTNRCCAFSKGNHDGTKEKGFFACVAKDGKLAREFIEVK